MYNSYLLYEYRDFRVVFSRSKIRISPYTIFFTFFTISFLYYVCILLSVSIKYLVSLYSTLHSYNKQFTSWLVRLYDFYYSLIVKDCQTHSFAALTRSSNDPLQLVNKNRTRSPAMR